MKSFTKTTVLRQYFEIILYETKFLQRCIGIAKPGKVDDVIIGLVFSTTRIRRDYFQ